jgi:pimeloyl-ACP methyl ester carboxylesterase
MNDIYYETIGTGMPVICLHGNGESHKIFNELADDLKDSYRLILIDSRYQGKSVKKGTLSLDVMCEDVMHVADKEQLDSYSVIGFSDGANIALKLAQKDKRMMTGILLSPNSSPKGIKGIYRFHYMMQLIFLVPFCLYNKQARRNWKLIRFMFSEPHFSQEELSKINTPMLLLSGSNDMIKKEDIDFIAASLPHCVSQVIDPSTHFLLRDAYGATIEKIRGFLDATKTDAYHQ